VSHYILERSKQTPFKLQPTRVPTFKIADWHDKLGEKDKVIAERVEALLQLGLKDEASCELKEFTTKSVSHEKILLASLFRYASGDWLESIKLFGKLPRSFRHSLAYGFERILFPRAYSDLVQKFSKKLGLDEDFIYAIIRQESVFNPRAISPVGARGLMQLMPATARLEAKRLGKGYVSRSIRREMIRNTRSRRRLLDAETNITLGVHHVRSLMRKYQGPVFVLTAYNASPRATERWKTNILGNDLLTFIERIPYRETNAYVKLVLRNYFYYKRWYQHGKFRAAHLDAILPKEILKLGPPLARVPEKRQKS
jgi:soluble lytic murein transglycosylase